MSFEDKAKALLLLKDSLGAFYENQKKTLLDQVLRLPPSEAAPVLGNLLQCSFIDPAELAALTTQLVLGGASSPSSTSSPPPPPPSPLTEEKGKEKVDAATAAHSTWTRDTNLLSIVAALLAGAWS